MNKNNIQINNNCTVVNNYYTSEDTENQKSKSKLFGIYFIQLKKILNPLYLSFYIVYHLDFCFAQGFCNIFKMFF